MLLSVLNKKNTVLTTILKYMIKFNDKSLLYVL